MTYMKAFKFYNIRNTIRYDRRV